MVVGDVVDIVCDDSRGDNGLAGVSWCGGCCRYGGCAVSVVDVVVVVDTVSWACRGQCGVIVVVVVVMMLLWVVSWW